MHKMRFLAFCLGCASSAVACRSNVSTGPADVSTGGTDEAEIRAASYGQTCSTIDDCLVVIEGQCGECGYPCAVGAINKSDQARYETDFNAMSCQADNDIECSQCPIKSHSGVVDVAGTAAFSGMAPELACEANVCIIK